MNEIQYVGENLLPGQLGHLSVILSFVTGILATVAYFFATNNRHNESYESWKNLGRTAFAIHGLSVFIIIGTIFYLMVNQYYEYSYAYEHTSPDLPMKYIASAFWEGQEGSFLLWMFWHVVLGGVLMFFAKKWESPVLSVIALVQVFLMSMILGLYFGVDDVKIGSNPFVLLRDVVDAPIFSDPEYLSKIAGDGLNPLLQNYWMTIHPPTLFLGFASTVVPFAFAIAGLWTRDFKGWLKPVLSWSLFSGFILGLGILMGGAWAYEALSFGGYWAWDPVENMSLVPWLILVAGIHAVMIAKNTGHSLKMAFMFLIASFGMIVYSTFLTRSGILGDTSVHAFTDMGLEWQLIIFLCTIFLASFVLLLARWRQIPENKKEETAYSREFWMFMGSLILIFSAILITFTTSIPVYNKLSEILNGWFPSQNLTLNWSTPNEPIEHYNKYQIWIAVLISTLSGVAQFMRYKAPSAAYLKKVGIHVGISAIAALVVTAISFYVINMNTIPYLVLMFASSFGVISNLDYVISILRGNIKISASAVSHIGFAIMVIGTLVSGLNKEIISKDAFMRTNIIDGFSEDDENNNILLYKNLTTKMGEYLVTYKADTIDGFNRYFVVNYQRLNEKGEVTEEFDLTPNIIYDKNEPKIAASNPSTKHYVHRDIFTHVSALPRVELEPEYAKEVEDSLDYKTFSIQTGESIELKEHTVTFIDFNNNPKKQSKHSGENDLALGAILKIKSKYSDSTWTAEPVFIIRKDGQFGIAETLEEIGLKIKFSDKFPEVVAAAEANLTIQIAQVKQGETFKVGSYEFTLTGFDKNPQNLEYKAVDGDIAVASLLNIKDLKTGTITKAEPVYVIRNNQIITVQDELRNLGLRVRFQSINPEDGKATFEISTGLPQKQTIVLDIAEDVNRSDYIVMEAIVFPGINLFWLGSLLMLFGLLQGWILRLIRK